MSDQVTYAACPKCLKLNKIALSRANPVCGACGSSIDVHGAVVNVSTQQLQQMIAKSPLTVVADFWAPWCGPCRQFAPTFEQVAKESAGKAVFVKVNTEADPQASAQFGVRGIPTLAAFRNGQEKGRQSGAMPYAMFKNWVNGAV